MENSDKQQIDDLMDRIDAAKFTTKESFITLFSLIITLFFHFVFTIINHL